LSSSSLTINPLFNTCLDEEDLLVWAIRPVILFPFFSPCLEKCRKLGLQPLVATAYYAIGSFELLYTNALAEAHFSSTSCTLIWLCGNFCL
jgi:hypothetical protein